MKSVVRQVSIMLNFKKGPPTVAIYRAISLQCWIIYPYITEVKQSISVKPNPSRITIRTQSSCRVPTFRFVGNQRIVVTHILHTNTKLSADEIALQSMRALSPTIVTVTNKPNLLHQIAQSFIRRFPLFTLKPFTQFVARRFMRWQVRPFKVSILWSP